MEELEELILYWKDEAAMIRTTYPGLHEIVIQTIKALEELKRLHQFGIKNIEVDIEQPQEKA